MGFAEGLVQDLAEFEALRRARGVARPGAWAVERLPPDTSGDDLRHLSLLRSETVRIAALVAAAASIARHGVERRSAGGPVDGLDLFAPRFSQAASQQMADLSSRADYFELGQVWQQAEARLAFAGGLAHALATGGAIGSWMPLDVLADAWSRAGAALLDWHGHLARMMAARGVTTPASVETQALDVLRQAASGACPCIDADGMFSLPGWAERRQDRRRILSLDVDVIIGGRHGTARLDNLSRGGMQLTASMPASIGARAGVVVPDGRTLGGTVRWCDGGRIGLALASPLADDDGLWLFVGHVPTDRAVPAASCATS